MGGFGHIGGEISKGFKRVGNDVANNVTDAGNNIMNTGNRASSWLAGANRYSNTELERGAGSGMYDSFDPGLSMNFHGASMHNPWSGRTTMHNPWAAGRLAGAGVGAAVMAPFMLAGMGAPGAAASAGANVGMLHNYMEHDRRLKEQEKWNAYKTRNADMAAYGHSGINGNIASATTGNDVAAVLAHYAQMRQAAQAQYEGSILDQLQSFMSMSGDMFGGNNGPLSFMNSSNYSSGNGGY